MLTAKRNKKAAQSFLAKALGANGTPDKINIDKSGATLAALDSHNDTESQAILVRQNKYLNNIIEQDHRPIKLLCCATLGFQIFRTVRITIGGFEAMRMLRKGQVGAGGQNSR